MPLTDQEKRAQLEQVPLFRDCSPDVLEQLATATAYAVGDTVCLALASWDLMAVLEREPVLAKNMLKELAGRLRAADAQLRH